LQHAFVLLRRFRDLPDALLFDSILDSSAIESFLADENTIRMDWFWSDALGGYKLCVRKADADAASTLLNQGVIEKFDVDAVGEYQQPRCPNCQSLEISFQGLNKPVNYIRALFGGPRPLHRSLWQCDSCAHQWLESTEKPPAGSLISASSILLIVLAILNVSIEFVWMIDAVRSLASQQQP
jgi:hypothetical protein